MRTSSSNLSLPFAAALAIAAALCAIAPPGVRAQADVPAVPDTVVVEEPEAPESGGRVRISIDESGISVEGDTGEDTGDEWIDIYDVRGPYKEKGVDIVKFGTSVFVAKDELVRGDLVVFGANAIIEGRVTGNVFVVGGNIRARSGAEIKGDAMVVGGVLDEDDDVIIRGERILVDDILPELGIPGFLVGQSDGWIRWIFGPVVLFIKLVLAFLVVLFLRERVHVTGDHASGSYLKSFGAGLLTAFVGVFGLAIIMVPLIITVIGIPLALLLLVSCFGVFIIAWTVFSFALGRQIAGRMQLESQNPFLFVFIGAVVISIPDIIAFGISVTGVSALVPLLLAIKALGWLVRTFAYVTGLGALVLARFGSRPVMTTPRTAPPPPPGAMTTGV